jgi:glycosyltransferase involved in cell wall biosynthesis
VQGYLAAFDVVLLPNQRKVTTSGGKGDIGRWTSPLKAFEYMAAGKAILASDIPVLREVLEDGVNALLCEPDDIGSWLNALQKIGSQPEYRKALGLNARDIFERQYTWQARAENIVDFAMKNLEQYQK